MVRKRFVILGFAAATFIAAVVLFGPHASTLMYYGMESVAPERISWEGKTAWKRCVSALDGRSTWPDTAKAACAAMNICAHEAPLTETQKQQLSRAMQATGCTP